MRGMKFASPLHLIQFRGDKLTTCVQNGNLHRICRYHLFQRPRKSPTYHLHDRMVLRDSARAMDHHHRLGNELTDDLAGDAYIQRLRTSKLLEEGSLRE
jgi:hypothetical protein